MLPTPRYLEAHGAMVNLYSEGGGGSQPDMADGLDMISFRRRSTNCVSWREMGAEQTATSCAGWPNSPGSEAELLPPSSSKVCVSGKARSVTRRTTGRASSSGPQRTSRSSSGAQRRASADPGPACNLTRTTARWTAGAVSGGNAGPGVALGGEHCQRIVVYGNTTRPRNAIKFEARQADDRGLPSGRTMSVGQRCG